MPVLLLICHVSGGTCKVPYFHVSSVEWRLYRKGWVKAELCRIQRNSSSIWLLPGTEQTLPSPPSGGIVFIYPDSPIISFGEHVVLTMLDEWIKGELLVKVPEKDLGTEKKMQGKREKKTGEE